MTFSPNTTKVRPEHLNRKAFIYVRQSTLAQVRNHTGSTGRQYNLVQRASDLGWHPVDITVIDQDQGKSGASSTGRSGFEFIVAEVSLGRAGAVFSLEASRLARSCSDWYRLLEICSITETLIVDDDGVYDPTQYNDRLLLGFRGTMSEAELHWLRSRMYGGKIQKAKQGKLRFRLPVGFIFDKIDQVILDPDEEVQQAIRLLFNLYEEKGSAGAVVRHFFDHNLQFPTRMWGGIHDGELVWNPLQITRVRSILHNPRYAGTYVFGRTKNRSTLLPGETPKVKGRTRQVKREEWPIVIHNAHPGYITWEKFLRNQSRMTDSRSVRNTSVRGIVRKGSALLQGIVLCGRCGRRMRVKYIDSKQTSAYECNSLFYQFGGKMCQNIMGNSVNAAVTDLFLEAIKPAQLKMSIAALEQLELRAKDIDDQWQRRLERARYEADLAKRRFMEVDPENRLVARSLERDWNDRLTDIEHLEKEYASLPNSKPLTITHQDRQRILKLAHDIPTVWHADSTTFAERKQLLRLLIKDVTLTKLENSIRIDVRWQTNACSTMDIPKPKKATELFSTDSNVVEQIRKLSPNHSDSQIADLLNEQKFKPARREKFTSYSVKRIRDWRGIPTGCPQVRRRSEKGKRGDGRYSTYAAAEILNVDISAIARWCRNGKLDCIRAASGSPWWISLTEKTIKSLRKPIRKYCFQRKKSKFPKNRPTEVQCG